MRLLKMVAVCVSLCLVGSSIPATAADAFTVPHQALILNERVTETALSAMAAFNLGSLNRTPRWIVLRYARPYIKARQVWRSSNLWGQTAAAFFTIPALPCTWISVPWILFRNDTYQIYFPDLRAGFKGHSIKIYKLNTLAPMGGSYLKKTSFGHFARPTRIDEWPQLWSIVKRELCWFGPRPTQFQDSNSAYIQLVLNRMYPGLFSWNNLRRVLERELTGSVMQTVMERIDYDLNDHDHSTLLDRAALVIVTLVTWFGLLWKHFSPTLKKEPLYLIVNSIIWFQDRRLASSLRQAA
jgi:lipopolysaccharide/colanic/teichoic acid biosynthesis glycosyltransferase